MTVDSRGTSNTNDRGSAETRRRRKQWLFETWAADWDVVDSDEARTLSAEFQRDNLGALGVSFRAGYIVDQDTWVVERGLGRPAVRCFRCGTLLDWDSVEIDRIKPGAEGGRYTKSNIRPVCGCCNKTLAGEWVKRRNAKRKAANQRRRDLRRKCGICGAVPAAGNACESVYDQSKGRWVTVWYCHPDEGYSCYSGDVA